MESLHFILRYPFLLHETHNRCVASQYRVCSPCAVTTAKQMAGMPEMMRRIIFLYICRHSFCSAPLGSWRLAGPWRRAGTL